MVLSIFITTCVFAKSTDISDVLFDLHSFGIIQADESNSLNLESNITRAEFVKMVVILMGNNEVVQLMEYKKIFDDVPETYWASKYINFVAQLEIIKVADNNLFNPDNFITYIEAIKILVSVTGYDYYAVTNGGHPDGYLTAANYAKISSGLSAGINSPLSMEQAMILIFNTLDVNIMVADKHDAFKIENGNTYRNKLQNISNRQDIREGTGIVTAIPTIWLKRPNTSMKQNQIEIDGILYDIASELAPYDGIYDYLGQQVDFIVNYEDNEIGEIIKIKLTNKNSRIVIDSEGFSKYHNNSIEYWSDDKLLTEALNDNITLVKNGRIVTSYLHSDITVNYGNIMIIDNDGDNLYDIIFIEEYGVVRVGEVYTDNETIYFAKHTKYNEQNSIALPSDEKGKSVLYYTAEGNTAAILDIKKDDILSICQSEDKDFTKIYISSKKITGVIQEITDDSYIIDDISYDVIADLTFKDKAQVGNKVVLYLAYEDEIADVEEYKGEDIAETGKKYAYVIGMEKAKGLSGGYNLKLIIPGSFLQVDVLKDETDISNTETIKAAEGMNKDVIVLKTANSINFINEKTQKISSEKLPSFLSEDTAIIYELNSNGDIKEIRLPERINIFDQKYLNAKQLVFGRSPGGSFGTDEKTKVVCAPTNIVEDDEDYYVKIKMNDGQRYSVVGYDINSNTDNAELIVIREAMSYNSPGIISSASKLAVINSVSQIIDDNGEARYKVTLFSEGEMKNFVSSRNSYVYNEQSRRITSESAMAHLSKGDVVYYELNGGKEINGVRIIRRLSGRLKAGISNPTSDGQFESIIGPVQNIDLGRVMETSGNRSDLITVLVDSKPREYEVGLLSNIPYIVYDARGNMDVRKGSTAEITPSSGENGDWIQITRWYGSITGIVIIK